jgi:hypothetical protein
MMVAISLTFTGSKGPYWRNWMQQAIELFYISNVLNLM